MIEAYIFTSSLREFFRPRRIAIWLLLGLAMYGIGHAFQGMAVHQTKQDSYILLTATLVYRVLPLAAAIFSTAIVAQEVEQRTIVYLLTRPVPRWKLLVFRALAAMIVVFAVTAFGALLTSLSVYGSVGPLLRHDLVAIAVGAVAYTSLFTFVSLLLNRSMIVSLLFAFGWETAVPNMPGDLYRLTVNSYLTSIAQRPSTTGPKSFLDALGGMLGVNSMSPSTAWTTMALLVGATLAASAYWFTHFEYTPREDAE